MASAPLVILTRRASAARLQCTYFKTDIRAFLSVTFQIWLPEKTLKTEQDHIDFQKVMADKRASIRKDMTSSRIELVMPKMKLDFDEDITDGFKDLGVNKVFEYGQHFDQLFGSGKYPNTAIRNVFNFHSYGKLREK